MNIPKFSVSRPITILMIMLAFVLIGMVALFSLNIDLFPDVDFPITFIQAPYPGVDPTEMENIVTSKIEEEINTVQNIRKMTSQSFEGYSWISIEFNWGTDIDLATIDLREKVDIAKRKLPRDMEAITVSKFDINAQPVLNVALGGEVDLKKLRDIADNEIKPAFEHIPGVANVEISGGFEREIKILVDPVKLKALNLTINDVINAISTDNLNTPVGNITDSGYKFLIRSEGEAKTISDLGNIIIKNIVNTPIYIKDIAKIVDGYKEINSISRLNTKPAINISIKKEASENPVRISDMVKKLIPKLEKKFKNKLNFIIAHDSTDFIRDSIEMVKGNATTGALLAAVVLFIFLKNLRATFIISLSIPLSVIIAFAFMFIKRDMTLNLLTLGGLALGVGMMVDNSIVVLENIYRHFKLNKGNSRIESSIIGANEVLFAILASTLTTIAVFLPIGLVPRVIGEMFWNMSLAILFSLIASYIVAITVIPLLASKMLKISKNIKEPVMDKLKDIYKFVLSIVLKNGFTRWGYFILVLFILAFSFKFMPGMEFFPPMDRGVFMINFELPEGTSIGETDKITEKIENILLSHKKIVTKVISTSKMGSGNFIINLIDKTERNISVKEFINKIIRPEIEKIPGITAITFQEPKLGKPRSGKPIQIEILGNDFKIIEKLCKKIAKDIKNVKGIKDIDSGVRTGRPEIKIEFDREKIKDLDLNLASISSMVKSYIYGTIAGKYREKGQEYDIRVEAKDNYKDDIEKLKNLEITLSKNKTVLLSQIAKIYESRGYTVIRRKNLKRFIAVEADFEGRALQPIIKDINKILKNIKFPMGYTYNFGGDEEERRESFRNLFFALIASILLVYMIMASQFESLLQPFIIMFTIPLSIIGVILTLRISNFNFSITAMVGLIMLSGIVVNNGIILIDYINKRMEKLNEGKEKAAIEAGVIRIRPILMTTFTTILGMLPLAFGIGAGSDFYQPLAITVIGGLAVSTFFTLTFIPVTYVNFMNIKEWFIRLFSR